MLSIKEWVACGQSNIQKPKSKSTQFTTLSSKDNSAQRTHAPTHHAGGVTPTCTFGFWIFNLGLALKKLKIFWKIKVQEGIRLTLWNIYDRF